ncbi:hypothetical protein K458DRAFT_402587 [Lentithecium fluviatile CBS 122367]|uniref:Uncharacterized protein n=1 Tax=Lentithecium fluviatile CBS 122367 TaxID=1168545 RepID=A0A6G1J686_9PLEO|nr:hypothetical protein K458DRAFT_402587 [Lentithecium fluviatile CBS 122367]
MRAFSCTFAMLWLLQLVLAEGEVDLVPMPRHLWDGSMHVKRDATTEAANISLTDHEEMRWTSPPEDPKPKIVSMVVWTGQDRLILDMAKFGFELKKVNCTENMMVQFRHNVSFQAAKKNWDWVNFNGMRSFVLIADHFLCGKDWSPDPWLISTVKFNQTDLTVKMEASKKTWKYISHAYTLDFGEQQMSRKRQGFLDFNLDRAFALDLSSKWPSKILNKTWTSGGAKATFDVSCVDCGTSGQLVFNGHIEGSAFGGIDKFAISATPNQLQAALNLQIGFDGVIKLKDAKDEFDLLTIPLPAGWRIPGVLTFGPNAKIKAGYSLDKIAGSATITTGVAAVIPDDSLARVDLFGKKSLDIHGWIPTFETQPLQLQAELSATGSLYTKVAVAVSLEVLDENGVNVDVNLAFPKLSITASGGYDANGFCNADPFGVSLDIDLGAELELTGWTEIDGDKNVLFEVDLFKKDDIFEFPPFCLGLGSDNPGSCSAVIDEEDAEWYNNEVDDPVTALARLRRIPLRRMLAQRRPVPRRSISAPPTPTLEKRARRSGYYMSCDSKKNYRIYMKDYNGPEHLASAYNANPTGAPIMLPGIDPCGDDDSMDCLKNAWTIEDSPGYTSVDKDYWDSEHVYEGDWVKSFLNYLYEKHFKAQTGDSCKTLGDIFFNAAGQYMDKLLTQLGTIATADKTMTVLTKKENQLKHRIFAPVKHIDRIAEKTTNPHIKLCRVARIAISCKYMMHQKVQAALLNTLTGYTIGGTQYPGIDGVFQQMDADTSIWADNIKPTNFTTWANEHKEWFKDMYELGIAKARAQLQDYAYFLVNVDDFDDLFDADTRKALEAFSVGDLEEYCKDTLSWT